LTSTKTPTTDRVDRLLLKVIAVHKTWIERKYIMKSCLAGFFAIALLASTARLPAQNYNIADLGAVPGQKVSKGYALNDLGQAAGVSENPSGAIATLFSNGKALSLGTLEPGFDAAIATAINGSGQVVGYEPFSSTPNNTSHAFLYSNGSMKDIHSASLFPAGTMAEGINGFGEVVGQGNLTSWSFHAFVYSNGRMVDIGPPGAYQASACAVNDAGQVVGNYYSTTTGSGAFLYANGKFTYLGAPHGASAASAFAINSTGQIAGALYFTGVPSHAALYSNGIWTDLGAIPAAVGTHATGINTAGQVVGISVFPTTSYHPFRPGKHVGFIVRNGSPVDLNTLIAFNSGFTITDATGINDSGDILCDATNTSGYEHAILLTPK
jgi:probable HAF family extracellular repeat protein